MWFRTVSTLRWSSAAIWFGRAVRARAAAAPRSDGESGAGCAVRRGLVDLDVHDLPEHRDHLLSVSQRNGADVDQDALSVELRRRRLRCRSASTTPEMLRAKISARDEPLPVRAPR